VKDVEHFCKIVESHLNNLKIKVDYDNENEQIKVAKCLSLI